MRQKYKTIISLCTLILILCAGCTHNLPVTNTVTSLTAQSDLILHNAPTGFTLPSNTEAPYIITNNNTPYFEIPTYNETGYEHYSDLDELGRCGIATALLGPETLPNEERGPIGSVKPSGWQTVKYNDIIDGNYLYNRCHLIAFCLASENANEKNLITGTRYMNVDGMLPFELQILDYIQNTDNHVLYKVSPVFVNNELIARGVLIEAQSLEDNELCFCVYCPNVQPGITIDYKTGDSTLK